LCLSWLGLWAYYDLLKKDGIPAPQAALAVATLAFNPLFLLLQGTFLTDVPALSLALIALALYQRALDSAQTGVLAIAAAIAILAAATRQNTLGIVPVVAMLLWRRTPLSRRPEWWIMVLLPAVVGLGVHTWFQDRADVRAIVPRLPPPHMMVLLPFLIAHFCGLAALPVLALSPRPRARMPFLLALAVVVAGAGYWMVFGAVKQTVPFLPYGGLFPYYENMLTPWGAFAGSPFTGPLEVGDRPLVLGIPLRIGLTILGCLAAARWLAGIVERRRASADSLPACGGGLGWGNGTSTLTLFTLWQVPFLLAVPEFYDRYLLVLLPGALAVTLPAPPAPRWRRALAIGLALVFAAVSAALMHDWLSWNSARWTLGRRALAQGIAARDIEGGFEWDGWYAPEGRRPLTAGPPRGLTLPFTHRKFPHVTGRFALSFSPVPGTITRDSEPYTLWLAPGPRRFWLLEVPAREEGSRQ
jgi:hypothetical protein